ncbi:GNAT family N-acetyltransferase [Stappia sp. GBMRC 2046]|uniref:GNAT family N-acetyltransferase n=1 Tax=Stappia sediminis TaxID=2692190 RepID=A0A7X3LS95_9HYPH|nr:GNAT family N-acetyltransferase [Stappia sediminis]
MLEPGGKLRKTQEIPALSASGQVGTSQAESSLEAVETTACIRESEDENSDYNPFISHAFLSSLEEAGCATANTGWLGQHLVLEEAGGAVHAALPCYLKNHSLGEYVFDHGWADAFHRAGGNYYPKLQSSVPFTPATGRRFLTAKGINRDIAIEALSNGLAQLCRRVGASSAHITFLTRQEWDALESQGYLRRTDQQFHWLNDGYSDFDEFLENLASRKRKQIRRERREAVKAGIEIEWITGSELTESHWDAFYEFYMDTGSRKWGRPYLNREFFSLLSERMADRILLIMAYRDGRPIAGALNLIGSSTLFGRNWGCVEDHPFLHFEVCYYQAIEFAIQHGLSRVEAGAQGTHKLARGYLPTTTYSAHWIAHPGLREAVGDYLIRERQAVEIENEALAEHSPFRRTSDSRPK